MSEVETSNLKASAGREVISSIRIRLAALREELASFLSDSESAFIETGKRLEGLAQRSSDLVSSAERDLTVHSAYGASAPAESLNMAIGHMEEHLATSRAAAGAGRAALGEVLKETDEVLGIGSEFQRIASAMRALATSLRVEEGRSGHRYGFDLVASEVVKLGELIAEKFRLIFAQAASLHGSAEAAHRKEEEFLHGQGECAASLAADARTSLGTLAALNEKTAQLRASAVAAAREIARASNDILVLLQAHDIARQMLEHVIEALASWSGQEVADGSPTRPELADIPTFCRIQAEQIRAAREQLTHAYAEIARDLRTVSEKTATVADETQSHTKGQELLDKVEGGVTELMTMLRDQLGHERETFAAAAAVVVASAGMARFVGEIATIAHDVKVLALNSLVKAVKAGNSGAVFAILAEAVKEIATDVANNTQRVGQSMQRIAAVAKTSTRAAEGAASEGAGDIEAHLSQLLDALRSYHDGLGASLRAMTAGSATLGTDVQQLTRGLGRQAKAAEALRKAELEFVSIAEESKNWSVASAPGAHEQPSVGLEQYTMESERRIHRMVAAGALDPPRKAREAAPATGGNVEFF